MWGGADGTHHLSHDPDPVHPDFFQPTVSDDEVVHETLVDGISQVNRVLGIATILNVHHLGVLFLRLGYSADP